jgi:hypothetical protein
VLTRKLTDLAKLSRSGPAVVGAVLRLASRDFFRGTQLEATVCMYTFCRVTQRLVGSRQRSLFGAQLAVESAVAADDARVNGQSRYDGRVSALSGNTGIRIT